MYFYIYMFHKYILLNLRYMRSKLDRTCSVLVHSCFRNVGLHIYDGYILDQVWFVALSICFHPPPHTKIFMLCCFSILEPERASFLLFTIGVLSKLSAYLSLIWSMICSSWITSPPLRLHQRADSDKSHTSLDQ